MVAIKTPLDLLAAVAAALSLATVASSLDRPLLLLAIGAVAGALWSGRRGICLLTPLPATLLALLGLTYYAVQVTRAEVATPVVHALVVLLAVRLLAAKQARDYLQIFALALFILAGSTLLSLEAGFILYLVLLVFVVTVSLVLLTVFVTDPRLALPHRDLWRLVRVALIIPAASLVLMLGFFVILPRTAHPLWNFLNPAGQAMAGLSESVNPGAFARLATVKTPAFRAEGPELPPQELYWRALVLNKPEGSRWLRREPPGEGAIKVVGGQPVTLTIYPEPRTDRYLVTLDRPLMVSGARSHDAPDQVFRALATTAQRFRYAVQVVPGAELQVSDRSAYAFYLDVPDHVSPRVAAAAAEIAASGTGSAQRLAALATFFQDRQLSYAQEDLPGGADPVDAFLFEKRRGYCEFFASAYVTLARLAGVPARLVGGYYGGDYNALGGYYLVTDDMAHVWAEVLTDSGAWVRVDPSQWAINAGTALGTARGAGLGPWQRLTDTVNYHWVQMVVVFDLNQQLEIWRTARRSWQDFRPGSLLDDQAVLWGGLTLVGAAVLIARGRRRKRLGREARLLAKLHTRVRRHCGAGLMVESFGLSELAERIDSDACREFARIYQGAVFRDRGLTAAEFSRLQALLREI
jgi:transglutaminase-like putative cysteine protease